MTEQQFREKLLDQLEEVANEAEEQKKMREDYRHFTRRVYGSLAILFAAVFIFVFIVLPEIAHDSEQRVSRSRRAALEQVCIDQKKMLTLLPPGYRRLDRLREQDPEGFEQSSLNPNRDCRQFAQAALNKVH